MARRRRLASASENFAATMARLIACSWNSGTPSVLPSTRCNSSGGPCSGDGEGKLDLLLAGAAAQIGMHHVALDRAGPHDRDLDHQIVEFRGRRRGSMFICARLSTWNTPMESPLHSMS